MKRFNKALLAAAVSVLSAGTAYAQSQDTDPTSAPSTGTQRSDTVSPGTTGSGSAHGTGTTTPQPATTDSATSHGTSGQHGTSGTTMQGSQAMGAGDTSGATDRGARGAALGGAANLANEDTIDISAMDDSAARTMQTKLQDLGFYQGEIDGIVGPQTKRALRAFYRAQADLVGQGKLLADGAAAFDLSASDIQPVRGQDTPAITRENANQRTQGSGTTQGSGSLSNPGTAPGAGSEVQGGTTQGTGGTPGSTVPSQQRKQRMQGSGTQGMHPNDMNPQGISPQGTVPQSTPSTPGTSP